MKTTTNQIFTILIALLLCSCSKDWLDIKSDKSLVVPSSLEDFQAILDNTTIMNTSTALGEIFADNLIIQDSRLPSLNPLERNVYTWKSIDVYEGNLVGDWFNPYQTIFYANIVLSGLTENSFENNLPIYQNIRGSALFYRALAHYQLIEAFSAPYKGVISQTEPGIPIKLTALVDEPILRNSVGDNYKQVLSDLNEALVLLPKTPTVKTRPSKLSTWGLLARIHMTLKEYDKALDMANLCLESNNKLIDYNSLNITTTYPFTRFNDEVLFDAFLINYGALNSANANINPALINQYNPNDLRRTAFFKPSGSNFIFTGSYGGPPGLAGTYFGGIATNEIYFIRAECLIRLGQFKDGITELNNLLAKRYKTGTFTPLSAINSSEALTLVLSERRKELLFRNLRFSDLRRINQEDQSKVTLDRTSLGIQQKLSPNDLRYTFLLPDDVVAISNLKQNPR